MKKRRFFRKASYCPEKKKSCKCWVCGEMGHYANECKNRKNNKLAEALGSLDYVEISEDEVVELAINNNKGIVEVVEEEEENEESDYKEVNEMMQGEFYFLRRKFYIRR